MTVTTVLNRIEPRAAIANIVTIGRRELRDALGSRWLMLYTAGFMLMGLGVSYASGLSAGGSGVASFGRTTAGLINLVLLVVPLMALSAGAGAIAGDRERGMLAYLLAQPISRTELLLGKFAGLAIALAASISLGFGVSALVLAWLGSATNPLDVARLALLSVFLATAMLSVGLLLSTFARRANVAIGTGVFTWLALVFATDLALMTATLTLRLPIERVFGIALANPMQVFKMWCLRSIDASLDVLGPAGLYGQETLGAALPWIFGGVLLAWTVLPLAVAAVRFNRSSIT